MQLKSKLPDVGSTIFTTMSKMAVDYDAINLGQGFPDFNADSKLLNLVSKAMSDGYNQYPYMTGVLELRQAISTKVHSLYGHAYEPDTEITITSGVTEAIMSAILATIHSGDEVIVLEPCYDCYIPAIRLAGGIPVRVQMVAPSRGQSVFTVDWDCVKAAITNKTRMLIVNTPHNPTGSIFSDDDLNALENIVDSSDILLLSDEVYEHIIFDEHKHKSLTSRPALVHRSFVISSFGKTTHTTGWKVGYCCAPKNLTAELRKVHQFVVFTVPSPFQHALATYTKNPESYLELSKFYEQKRNLLKNGLLKTRFKPLESHGTFFLLADYSQISNQSESEFSIWLAQHHGVVVIPVSAFYAESTASNANHSIVRFCFAKKDTTLESALDRLMRI